MEAAVKEIDACGRVDSPEYRLPEELQKTEKLRERIKGALDRLEEEKRKGINPLEPDARLTTSYGKSDLGYNAQAVTEEGGVIVAAEIVDNAGDMGALVDMLDEVKDTLGPRETRVHVCIAINPLGNHPAEECRRRPFGRRTLDVPSRPAYAQRSGASAAVRRRRVHRDGREARWNARSCARNWCRP